MKSIGLGMLTGDGGIFYFSAARVLDVLITHGIETREAWTLVQSQLVLPAIEAEIAEARAERAERSHG